MKRLRPAGERGTMLVEAIIVVGIVGWALTGMLGALSSGALGLKTMTSRNTAASLAGAQMEYIKSLPWETPPPTTYLSGVTVPSGFSITSEGQPTGPDGEIRRVIVTVTRDGQTVSTLVSLKVNRP